MARSAKDATSFLPGVKICYPAHGVGELVSIEEMTVGGTKIELYVITFPREKMTLRVPTHKAIEVGLVTLMGSISEIKIQQALKIIAQDRKISKAMWSRRATEYEQKVNSGDLLALAEVIRDLNQSNDDVTERSYSGNEILRKAARRLVDLLSAFWQRDEADIQQFLNTHLKKHRKKELQFWLW